jgi:hypothetical protein
MSGDRLNLLPPPRRPNGDAEWLIARAVSAMHHPDGSKDLERAESLLGRDVGSAVRAARRILDWAESDPLLRWSVVRVIASLGHDDTVDLLHEQAVRRIDMTADGAGCGRPEDAELLVAVMAVEGLGEQASRGSKPAIDALIDVMDRQSAISVRRAAGAAAVAAEPGRRDYVTSRMGDAAGLLDTRAARADDFHLDPRSDPDFDTRPKRFTGPKPLLAEDAASSDRPVVDASGADGRGTD